MNNPTLIDRARQLELVTLQIRFSVVVQDAIHVHKEMALCKEDVKEIYICVSLKVGLQW